MTPGHPDPVVTVQSRPGCPATIGSRMACSSALGEAFWTDAVLLAHAGIPTMLFGVDGAGAHAASEWVDLQSLHAGLLPQVVPTGAPVEATLLGLVVVHAVLALAWLNAYVALLHRGRDTFQRPRVRRTIERITGSVLIGFGVRIAMQHG